MELYSFQYIFILNNILNDIYIYIYIYIPMVMYIAIIFINFFFNANLKIPKY